VKNLRTRWVAPLAAVALLVAACGGDDAATPAPTTPTPAPAPAPEGPVLAPDDATLVIDRSFDLVTNDPHRQFEATGTILHHAVYDTLLAFPTTDITEPQPNVAESFTVNADATEFTFTIRQGIVFQDGTPLTAADVEFSINRLVNVKGRPAFIVAGFSAEATGEYEVVVRTEKSNPAVPFILTNSSAAIVNKALVEANGGAAGADANEADTAQSWFDTTGAAGSGSGAYYVESFDVATEVVLRRNENYWGDKPAWPRIVLRNAVASTQRLNVQSGETQLALDISGDDLGGLPSTLNITSQPAAVTFFIFANQNAAVSPLTANPDFVEAVRYGIDYASVADLAGAGVRQICGILPNMLLGALPDSECVTRDLDRAKAAFARSGAGNTPISLGYPSDFSANGLTFGPLAERVQANLAEVGINLILDGKPIATSLQEYRDGVQQMGLWLWNAGYPEPSYYLAFSPGSTVGLRAGWAAGSNDAIFDGGITASQTIDDAARGQLYQAWERLMAAEGPYVPLIQPSTSLVSQSIVTNVEFHPTYIVDLGKLGYGG
jgi:peptide/nickel transport system substrate-binding protein